MTSNRAAEIIAPWIEKEWGHPEDNAESAAEALADAGLLAPDLPEPDTQDERFTTFLLNGDVAVKINSKGAVIIEHVDVGWFALPPGESATLAGILLAAAAHAERNQK